MRKIGDSSSSRWYLYTHLTLTSPAHVYPTHVVNGYSFLSTSAAKRITMHESQRQNVVDEGVACLKIDHFERDRHA